MGEATIVASKWRLVEVGRILLIQEGPYTGRIATIVEIIDHKRVLVDSASSDASLTAPRHAVSLTNALLSPIIIPGLPRGARRGTVKAAWEKAEIDKKWKEGAWAKKRAQADKRRNLSDFDRFKVMRLQKQVAFERRKALAQIKASA